MKYIDLEKLRLLRLAISALAMWGLVTTTTHAQDDLEGSFGDNERDFASFKSVRAMNPRLGDVVVVDSVSNKEPVAATFSWTDATGRRFRFAGSMPPAQKKRMQIIPKTLTQKWNTFRRVEEVTYSVEWVKDKKERDRSKGPMGSWVAVGKGRDIIKQDAKLYGLLIDGEEKKGKTLLECSSVARKKDDGSYVYIYTVINSSGSPLDFEWAGFSQKLAPGKTFEKKIESKKLAKERSGAAKIKLYRDDPTKVPPVEYIITSPCWETPQE